MKRLFAILLCLAVLLTLGGCGKKKKTTPEDLLGDALDQAGDIYGDALDQVGDALGSLDGLTSDITGNIPGVGDITGNIPNLDGLTSGISGTVSMGGTGSHSHSYSSATCEDPQTCECGETRGSALGHNYSKGKCTRCGESDPDFVEVSYVSVSPMSQTVYVGESFTLSATLSPYSATNQKVTWSSSNNSVATVSSSGKVTAKGIGSATITAKSANGKTGTCSVKVEADPLAGCTLQLPAFPKKVSYKIGSTVYHSSEVHKVTYELEEDDGYITIKLVIAGEKTYDYYGNTSSDECYLAWKLYDADGYVVKTGTIFTPSMVVGENYGLLRATIAYYDDYIPVGTYRLDFVDKIN